MSQLSTDNIELDELHGFAGKKHPDEQESDLEKGPGRPKESQVVPDPRVRYGQVIKQRVGRRLV